MDVSSIRFFPPAWPTLLPSAPTGERWIYELKFDGYRVQMHKAGQTAAIFGRNGGDFTRRFPTIAAAVLALPVGSCIIDGELIAADANGHGRDTHLGLTHICEQQHAGADNSDPRCPSGTSAPRHQRTTDEINDREVGESGHIVFLP